MREISLKYEKQIKYADGMMKFDSFCNFDYKLSVRNLQILLKKTEIRKILLNPGFHQCVELLFQYEKIREEIM